MRAVADAIRLNLRSYDPVVRVGGDEFVCGFVGTDAQAAEQRIAQIQGALAASHRQATVSAGIAEMEAGETLDDLMARGDAQLYRVKGRVRDLMSAQPGSPDAAARRAGRAERAVLMAERARWASAWAETHAERGDYEFALKWLEVVRRSSGGLTPRQRRERAQWRGELDAGRRRGDGRPAQDRRRGRLPRSGRAPARPASRSLGGRYQMQRCTPASA